MIIPKDEQEAIDLLESLVSGISEGIESIDEIFVNSIYGKTEHSDSEKVVGKVLLITIRTKSQKITNKMFRELPFVSYAFGHKVICRWVIRNGKGQ